MTGEILAKPVLVFFDLDNTLLNGDSYRLMLAELYGKAGWLEKGYFAIIAGLRKSRLISHARFKALSLRPFRGWSKEKIAAWGELFFRHKLASRIVKEGQSAVLQHQAAGHIIVLATGAPDVYLSAVAHLMGVDKVLSTPLEYHLGKFTGRLGGADCLGKGKLAYAAHLAEMLRAEPESAWFYSDHITDLPLLEWVGHPTVVNPDRLLKAMAECRGWPVVHWS